MYAKSIADNLLPPGIGRERPPECLDEISSRSAGKVRLGAAAGWSNGRSSTVHPCLELSKGRVSLKVINNSYIFWQVASSTGTTIRTVPGDIDAEMVTLIARKIGADPGTQEYLARASELTVELPAEALPSRTELKSSTGTFLAEALWIALNVVVSIATGRQVPAAVKLAVDFVKTYIRPLLELTGIVGCMQKAVKLAQGKGATSEALSDLFDVFTSQCAQLIGEALADRATQVVPASFWSSQLAVLGALKKAGDSLVAGVAGQYQQGFPPVRITVNGNDFRLFVGTWRVHGSTVTIRADRTGLMDWNAGPCQDLLQDPGGPHCQGYANLRFGPVQRRVLTAQVTGDVYYRTWDTNELSRSRGEPERAHQGRPPDPVPADHPARAPPDLGRASRRPGQPLPVRRGRERDMAYKVQRLGLEEHRSVVAGDELSCAVGTHAPSLPPNNRQGAVSGCPRRAQPRRNAGCR